MAVRNHPDRWPFIVVMPQVPFSHHHWTDPDMMQMAMAELDASIKEFRGDPQRIYLTGLSLGGYGTWEIAKNWPHKFAAIVPVCGGVFWSYAPDRWRNTDLPEEYAHAIGRTPADSRVDFIEYQRARRRRGALGSHQTGFQRQRNPRQFAP